MIEEEDVREAYEERFAIMEEAGLPRDIARRVAWAAEIYYRHIMVDSKRVGCCKPSSGQYCRKGQAIMDEYVKEASEAEG